MADLFELTQRYVEYMTRDDVIKVFLFDGDTIPIISAGSSVKFLIERRCLLLASIHDYIKRDAVPNIRCVIFIRPTVWSCQSLCAMLLNPKYDEYHIYLSTWCENNIINQIAQADKYHRVCVVEVLPLEVVSINRDTFLLSGYNADKVDHNLISHPSTELFDDSKPLPQPSDYLIKNNLNSPQVMNKDFSKEELLNRNSQSWSGVLHIDWTAWKSSESLEVRATDALLSLCAARNYRFPVIRFQNESPQAQGIAKRLCQMLTRHQQEPETSPKREAVFLILDRTNDLLTPMLRPWSYQAMIREFTDWRFNCACLSKDSTKEFFFSELDDPFFAAHRCDDWGTICLAVKQALEATKKVSHIGRSNISIDDLKSTLKNISQIKELTNTAVKHATVVTHISDCIETHSILDVGKLQQDMLYTSDPVNHWNQLSSLARNSKVEPTDILSLSVLYAIRFGSDSSVLSKILQLLSQNPRVGLVKKFLQLAKKGSFDMLTRENESLMTALKRRFKDEPSNQNFVYHEPLLRRHLLALRQGRLDRHAYPVGIWTGKTSDTGNFCIDTGSSTSAGGLSLSNEFPWLDVVIFVVGGLTFWESSVVSNINHGTDVLDPGIKKTNMNVFIGSNQILNTESFWQLIESY